jgi:hypothetical protein
MAEGKHAVTVLVGKCGDWALPENALTRHQAAISITYLAAHQ